jgi:hypothetical protein
MRRREKKREPKQIPTRKLKRNKRIKKKSNFISLAGNRTRDPCHTAPPIATHCHT